MSLIRRAAVALVAGALGVSVAALPSAASASNERPVVSQACVNARAAAAKAHRATHHATVVLHKAQKRLKAAKKHHRPAKVKKFRHQVAKAKAHLHTAKVREKRANAHRRHNCTAPTKTTTGGTSGGTTTDTTGGTTGGTGTGTATADPTAAFGAILGMLSAAADGGTLPALDAAQVTSLLDGLYPGASSTLTPDQLTSLVSGFTGSSAIDPTELTALLGGGLAGFDPAAITDLANGGTLDPASAAEGVTALTSLLNTAGAGSFATPTTSLTSVLTGILGSGSGGVVPGLPCIPLPVVGCL